ncbi:MAG: hypothetical protein WC975_02530 [Phycisphaerae bacterium]
MRYMIIVALFGFYTVALAQYAPAVRPNALDASPQIGSGGYNAPVRLYNYNYNSGGFGNLYITGNVSGGKSFRGFVPYSDPTQFQGRLGSSALGAFQRDAIDLQRVQQGYSNRQTLPYYNRSSTILPLSAVRQGLNTPGSSMPRLQAQPFSESYGLRAAIALPLPSTETIATLPKNLKPTDILVPGILVPRDTQNQMEITSPLLPSPVEKIPPKEVAVPEQPSLEQPPTEQPPVNEQPQQDFATFLELQAEKAEKPNIVAGPQPEYSEIAKRLAVEGKFTPNPPKPPVRERPAAAKALPLVSELFGKRNDPFSRIMRAAQKSLNQGRFYDAVQQYSQALSINLDDPLPIFGQTNAFLGAGDLRTAADHLQQALKKFPKFLRLSFDGPRLLGGKIILDRRRRQLQTIVEKNNDRQLMLLLGYVEILSGQRESGLKRIGASGLVARDF